MVGKPQSPLAGVCEMAYWTDMGIDVRQLRYFLAVAAERSFTRGAERLNMAQPPLSKRIQELEAELGAPLFDRESRPLRLTPAGQLLHEQATQLVHRMEQLQSTMRRFIAAERPRFIVGLVPSTLYARFPELISRFRAVEGDIDLALAEMNTPEQVQALKEGRINVGFDRIRVDDPVLHHETLRVESLIVALPQGHPLLLAGRPVDLAELADMPLVIYPRDPRPSYADLVLSAFYDRGLAPVAVHEVQELQTGLVMVAAGTGACIVPETVRRMGRPDVGFLPIAQPIVSPLIARYRANDHSPALRQFFQVYAALYADWGWKMPAAFLQDVPADRPAVS